MDPWKNCIYGLASDGVVIIVLAIIDFALGHTAFGLNSVTTSGIIALVGAINFIPAVMLYKGDEKGVYVGFVTAAAMIALGAALLLEIGGPRNTVMTFFYLILGVFAIWNLYTYGLKKNEIQ